MPVSGEPGPFPEPETRWRAVMTRTERAGRSHPLAELLMELTPSGGAFPLTLIETLIERSQDRPATPAGGRG